MEVVVESLLSGAVTGRSVVRTVSTATVHSVIAAFCAQRGVTHWKSYILTDKDDVVLDNSYTLSMCAVGEGDTLYLTAKGGNETALGFHNWWAMVAVSTFIGSVGLVAVCLMYGLPRPAVDDFGIVFDAGSTHTLMHVYRWPGEKSNGTGEPVQIGRCHKDVGIAQYAETPAEVGEMLTSCVNEAKDGMVPQDRVRTTPIFLGATGGMRLLEIRNWSQAADIMRVARLTFAASGFSFSSQEQVRVLDGAEEGADAWVTANFLNGTLARVSGDKTPTVGIMDLGGASMQIAFQTDSSNVSVTTVQAFGIDHRVFSISYLCFGARESARRRVAQLVLASNLSVDAPIVDPCLPNGFTVSLAIRDIFQVPCTNTTDESIAAMKPSDNVTFEGSGDAATCSSDVRILMNTSECSARYAYCFAPPEAPLPDTAFMGLANFFYVMQSLNFTDGAPSLSRYDETVAKFCNRSRSEVPAGNETLCFQSMYVRAMLVDGFGFNSSSWSNLVFVDSMKGVDVDWALGYMMKETNRIPAETSQPRMQLPTFIVLILCFVAFFLLAIGFGIHAYKLRSVSPSYQRFSQYGAI